MAGPDDLTPVDPMPVDKPAEATAPSLAERGQELAAKTRDPTAALVGSLVGIAGSLGLLSQWGLSADELAQILGYVFAGTAALFTWIEAQRRKHGRR